MQEIDEESPLHGVAAIFCATYCILVREFKKALDIIAFYKDNTDNEIYKKFEGKILTFIPKEDNVTNFYDYVKSAA